MIDAWFSASEKTSTSGPPSVVTTARLAMYPVENSAAPLSGRGWGGLPLWRATQPTKLQNPPAAPMAA